MSQYFYLQRETLSDGSEVFNITNDETTIAAYDETAAWKAVDLFNAAVDVALSETKV